MSLLFNVEDFNNVVKEYKLASLYNKSSRMCGDADIDNYVVVSDVNSAWEYWFAVLLAQHRMNKRTSASRDGAVAAEVINAITVVKDPTRMIVKSEARKMPMRYAVGELLWYLSGSNRLKDISLFSSAWDRMSDDGETVNSCYGHKIQQFYGFDQWQDVINRLKADPNSRQAVIHIKNPRPMSDATKDTPCTLSLQFLLRDGRLNLTTTMRSNDVWTGVPYDMFSFCSMQVMMAMTLGVDVGTYTHQAGSLHIYERNLPDGEKTLEGGNETQKPKLESGVQESPVQSHK